MGLGFLKAQRWRYVPCFWYLSLKGFQLPHSIMMVKTRGFTLLFNNRLSIITSKNCGQSFRGTRFQAPNFFELKLLLRLNVMEFLSWTEPNDG